MKKIVISLVGISLVGASLLSGAALAETTYLKCEVQTTFRKPYVHDSEWLHAENKYTKYFKLDSTAKMVSHYDWRKDAYTPVCSDKNAACIKDWQTGGISIDATRAADNPVAPYLDFRRSIKISDKQTKVSYVIADYGQSKAGKPNMTWSYDGSCQASAAPEPVKRGAGGAGASWPPENPKYEKPTGPALSVTAVEADKALAGYYGNTMTGYSGGGHWFHMWFLNKGLAYTSDDEDISSEGKPRQWYVGKDSTGYRLCGEPIAAEGKSGCYPLPLRKVGDSWVQQDMDGAAYFSLLPGRQ
jgi:Ni/Co efflux regulator RcnB